MHTKVRNMSQQSCLPLPSRKERKQILKKRNSDKKEIDITQSKHDTEESTSSLFRQMEIDGNDFQGMSAMEYLAQVHAEAQKIPDTNVQSKKNELKKGGLKPDYENEIPIDGTCATLRHLLSHRTTLPECPTSIQTKPLEEPENPFLPCNKTAWVDTVLHDFSELRQYLEKCEEAGIGKSRVIQNLPSLKDRAGWHEYCLGKGESEGNAYDYFQDDNEDNNEDNDKEYSSSDMEEEGENDGAVNDNIGINTNTMKISPASINDGHPPTVQLILQMDQVMTRRVLSHLVYFLLQKWEATSSRMLWIYSLLANLKKPLHRDDLATLRSLLRECCHRRLELSKEHKKTLSANDHGISKNTIMVNSKNWIKGLNLVICIAGIYFEQGKREELIGKE